MTTSHPRSRTLPYLHRNWRTCVDSLETQAKMQLLNGDDDHFGRPAKRRRYADSPDSGLGPDLDLDELVLCRDPSDIHSAMRIDVLKISHKDDAPRAKQNPLSEGTVPAVNKDLLTKARCKITVTTPACTHTPGDIPNVLYCDSQMCDIRTLLNAAGVCRMARVYLPQPFLIPESKIFVQRHDDTIFDLADNYAVRVELESAGDDYWPPLNLSNSLFGNDMGIVRTAPRLWSLSAEVSNALDRGRRSGVLKLRRGFESISKTDFVVDIDVRWAKSLPKTVQSEQEHVYLAGVAATESFEEPLLVANGISNGMHVNGHLTNGHSHLQVEDDMEEEAEDELTPSRSRLRVRGSKTSYNLKELSAKSSGRQPRKRARVTGLQNADSERVLYRLPKEAVPIKEIVMGAFSCCVCYAAHQSLSQLRAHLLSHAQYKFEVNIAPGKLGHQLDVSYIDSQGVYLPAKIYSLGLPTKAFDLEKYVEGDDSWVTDRLGPNNQQENQEENVVVGIVPRKISQPRAPRIVPKNMLRLKLQQKPKKKIYVPHTQTRLFDPLSKTELVPATEAPQTRPDDSWLIQKHREIVQDFSDVASPEKEYIREWDAFIHTKRIVSEAFIGRAVVEFVMDKVDWLLDSNSRTLQFGKHLTTLVARGVEEDTVKLVQAKLRDARIQRLTAQTSSTQPPKESLKRKPKGCAVCGKTARGPGLLICANEDVCAKPIYHADCIRHTARMPVEHVHWRCNDCTH